MTDAVGIRFRPLLQCAVCCLQDCRSDGCRSTRCSEHPSSVIRPQSLARRRAGIRREPTSRAITPAGIITMATAQFSASTRTATGKGVARKLRAAGKVPAVIYGHGRDPQALELDAHAFQLLLE